MCFVFIYLLLFLTRELAAQDAVVEEGDSEANLEETDEVEAEEGTLTEEEEDFGDLEDKKVDIAFSHIFPEAPLGSKKGKKKKKEKKRKKRKEEKYKNVNK